MIELLLEKGADINCRFAGKTPFEYLFTIWPRTQESFLLYEGVGNAVKAFLEHGAQVNEPAHAVATGDVQD